jgi:hypothetical protein
MDINWVRQMISFLVCQINKVLIFIKKFSKTRYQPLEFIFNIANSFYNQYFCSKPTLNEIRIIFTYISFYSKTLYFATFC